MQKNELTLTSDEQTELIRLETIIENGRKSFIEVGTALMKIRNEKLYRTTHRNFEEYCREKWSMTRRYANNLIASTKVIENLGTIVPIQPTAESQVRPLTDLPPQSTARSLVASRRDGTGREGHGETREGHRGWDRR